jgi:hypothetical protein
VNPGNPGEHKELSIDDWRSLHALFHTLWTRAVGTASYDKRQWRDLERVVFRDAPAGFMVYRDVVDA